MASTIHDLLQPHVILDLVSRTRKNQGRLGRWFGFHYGGFDPQGQALNGPKVKRSPVRSGSYRIFDRTRTVAMGRSPDTGPAWTRPQPVGHVNYTVARFHEKIRLSYEELNQLAPIIGPQTAVDDQGKGYLAEQTVHLASRFANAIELMAAGVVRGKFWLKQDGDNWIPTLTLPTGVDFITVDLQIPAGNMGQMDMLGAGAIIDVSWANPAAKIISKHLPAIMEAAARLHGFPITDVFVSPRVWAYVITNTEVINTGGSANTPFSEFEYVRDRGIDGRELVEWVAVLRGYPTLRWHIMTDVLVADGGTDPSYAGGTGTLTPTMPENQALFLPDVTSEWVDLIECSEMVVENPGQPAVKRWGYHFWHEYHTQPACIELIGLLNAVPRVRVPSSIAPGTVVF